MNKNGRAKSVKNPEKSDSTPGNAHQNLTNATEDLNVINSRLASELEGLQAQLLEAKEYKSAAHNIIRDLNTQKQTLNQEYHRDTEALKSQHTIELNEIRLKLKESENLAEDLQTEVNKLVDELKKNSTKLDTSRHNAHEMQCLVERLEQEKNKLLDELALYTLQSVDPKVSPAFYTNAQARETRATDAIRLLEKEIVGATDRDKAIQAIVDYLRKGLNSTDPQAYFDANKEDIRSQVCKLNNWKSIAFTAVNTIVTVLAVCSVVGITAFWLTGTLDNNLSKRGSMFAFTAADKQKANRAFYEVEQSLSCKIGG